VEHFIRWEVAEALKRTRLLISDCNPKSPRWRASLVQNNNLVEICL
jgi:hypothetical protein